MEEVQKISPITRLTIFIVQSKRVWQILKKPSREEIKTIAKISALGLLIIGAIGFVISDAIRIITKFFT